MTHVLVAAAVVPPLNLGSEALAHATFAGGEVVQGQTALPTRRVPHGRGDGATLRVRIQIPEGRIAAQPMVQAGWTRDAVTGPCKNGHELWGNAVTGGVRETIRSGARRLRCGGVAPGPSFRPRAPVCRTF